MFTKSFNSNNNPQYSLRVAAVSYLNTRPFIEGIRASKSNVELVLYPPAQCANAFQSGLVDVALVPVGALPDLAGAGVLTGYCIGTNYKVDSVCIFANCAIHDVTDVYLDPHSRTSNGLTRLLFQHYWQRTLVYHQQTDYLDKIQGTTAGVVIGDRALGLKDRYRYGIDLAEAWSNWTGLPFTFAVWVYRQGLNWELLIEFEQALAHGVSMAASCAVYGTEYGISIEKAAHYLTQCISYPFTSDKRAALTHYLKLLTALEPLPHTF